MMEFVKLWLKIMRLIVLTIVVGAAISYPAVLLLTKAKETGSLICYIGAFVYLIIVIGLGTAIMIWETEG
jgi:hypothetical protein